MKNTTIIFLCVGCIIGWGAFVLPQDVFLQKGLFESLIGLFLGGVAMCLIATNYTFLLNFFRRNGGEFYFTLKALGRTHGFICGWFLTLAYLCIIPLNATALNVMIHSFGLGGGIILFNVSDTAIYLSDILVSMLSIIVIGVINVLGIRAAFVLQKLLVVALCGSVVVFFVIMSFDVQSLENLNSYLSLDSLDIRSIMIVFSLTPWAYLGFECAIQVIESIKYRKHLFNAFMYVSIWIGFLLYCLLIFITAFGISKPHILAPSWATYTSVSSFFGTFGGAILGISVCGAILSGINGFFIVTSKMLESLSIHHYLPQSLIKKNRFGVSYPIVCIVGFLSCLMVIFGRQSLLYIVDMACVGIIVGFLYVSSIAFLFKKRHLGYFSLSSFLSVILSIVFLLLEFLPFSPAALKLPSIIALVIWSGIGGIILYVLRQKM